MKTLLTRFRIEAEDKLRWNPTARKFLYRRAMRNAARGVSSDPKSILRSIIQFCSAARLAPDTAAMQDAEGMIDELIPSLDLSKVDWREWIQGVDDHMVQTAVILKPRISPREKGVVFMAFEDQWARLMWDCKLAEFAKDYTLVVSPTWCPPHALVNSMFPVVYPAPIFTLISGTNDLNIFPRLSKRYIPVPLYASSWVNPDLYHDVPAENKDLDIVMVANFAKYKRHFLLFKALADMPKSLRVVLIGQTNGDRGPESIMAEARAYGVADRFELLVNAQDTVVLDKMTRAKVTLILSRREGSCVAVAESLFANTPVGLFSDAEVGSRAFINQFTGRFLEYRNLSAQLMDFIANAHHYSPRAWAEQSISCYSSTSILNSTLKAKALAAGERWTQDIAPHHWRPYPELLSESDRERMKPSYDDIKQRFGIAIGPKKMHQKKAEQQDLVTQS